MHQDGSSVMFPLSCNIRPPRPNDPVGIDFTPTSIPAAKLYLSHTKKGHVRKLNKFFNTFFFKSIFLSY